jgi:thiol-disulfide isomerase/thioredoxin
MKRNTLILLLLALSQFVWAGKKKNNCVIQGKIDNSTGKAIFLKNLIEKKVDTLNIVDGEFKINCNLTEPTPFQITTETNSYVIFFAEPDGKVKLNYDQKEMRITKVEGSTTYPVFESLLKMQAPLQKEAQRLNQLGPSSSNKDSIQQLITQINKTMKSNFFSYLQTNAESEATAFIVYNTVSTGQSIQSHIADTMLKQLKGKALNSYFGKEISSIVKRKQSVEVGFMAPDFTLPDSSGEVSYSLSKLIGKYVLVDFWASWCGPCKQEIPFLKKAYEKFRGNEFEILSVSLDDKRNNWTAALRQFEMPWPQISDSKGFKSIINELYYIPSIPKTLLLDKTGKIIATDLRGDALETKLSELLVGK